MDFPANEDGIQPVVIFAVRPPSKRVVSALGFYTERHRVEAGDDDECYEICEDDGIRYLKEGWHTVHLYTPRPLDPNFEVIGWAYHPEATEGCGSPHWFGL